MTKDDYYELQQLKLKDVITQKEKNIIELKKEIEQCSADIIENQNDILVYKELLNDLKNNLNKNEK